MHAVIYCLDLRLGHCNLYLSGQSYQYTRIEGKEGVGVGGEG